MKDNFLKIIEKYRVFVLFFIILMQVLFITYVFATQKNGFHSDEAWSYGFANSYYVPYIYKEGNSNPHQVEKLTNFGNGYQEMYFGIILWLMMVKDLHMILCIIIKRTIKVHHFIACYCIQFVPFFQILFLGGMVLRLISLCSYGYKFWYTS